MTVSTSSLPATPHNPPSELQDYLGRANLPSSTAENIDELCSDLDSLNTALAVLDLQLLQEVIQTY